SPMFFSRRRQNKKGHRRNRSSAGLRARTLRMESLEDRHLMSAAQIVAENKLAGTSDWEIDGELSANIEGYAAQFSVNHGQTVQFKIDTDSDDYRIDIYRMGWYGGAGGRKVATVQPTNFQSQPDAIFHLDTNSIDASNWHTSASWAV